MSFRPLHSGWAPLCTLHSKSLLHLALVWSKITPDTGNVEGARAAPQSWKMRTSFLMSLALCMPIFNKWELWDELSNKNYLSKKWQFLRESFSEALFYWKLLKIGIWNAKDITKDVPICQIWETSSSPPTLYLG